jgi:organic hydroperoxide reductase OsmC/OhrA
VNIREVHTEVKVNYVRNEQGRLRIGKIDVDIQPKFDPAELQKAQRCLELFEDYCVVTQSVRKGIDVSVAVNASASAAVE